MGWLFLFFGFATAQVLVNTAFKNLNHLTGKTNWNILVGSCPSDDFPMGHVVTRWCDKGKEELKCTSHGWVEIAGVCNLSSKLAKEIPKLKVVEEKQKYDPNAKFITDVKPVITFKTTMATVPTKAQVAQMKKVYAALIGGKEKDVELKITKSVALGIQRRRMQANSVKIEVRLTVQTDEKTPREAREEHAANVLKKVSNAIKSGNLLRDLQTAAKLKTTILTDSLKEINVRRGLGITEKVISKNKLLNSAASVTKLVETMVAAGTTEQAQQTTEEAQQTTNEAITTQQAGQTTKAATTTQQAGQTTQQATTTQQGQQNEQTTGQVQQTTQDEGGTTTQTAQQTTNEAQTTQKAEGTTVDAAWQEAGESSLSDLDKLHHTETPWGVSVLVISAGALMLLTQIPNCFTKKSGDRINLSFPSQTFGGDSFDESLLERSA